MFNTIIASLLGAVLSALAGAVIGVHFYSQYADAVLAQTKAQWLADTAVRSAQQDRGTIDRIDAVLRETIQEQKTLTDRLSEIDRRTYSREKAWRKERESSQTCDMWMRQPVGCSLHDGPADSRGPADDASGTTIRMPHADSMGP